MRRREFVAGVAGAAALWPFAAHAQQPERMRRIAVLMDLAADDTQGRARFTSFLHGLREAGWIEGSTARIDLRWGGSDSNAIRKYAADLVGLAPEVILAGGSSTVMAFQMVNTVIPIVFVNVVDPVGSGMVESLAKPGSNITGFTSWGEYGTSGKWLELIKEIAPSVKRVAVLRDPSIASGSGQLGAIQSVAPSLGIETRPYGVRNAEEIERDVGAFAREPNGSLIIPGSGLAVAHRELIVALAARHRLPAVYFQRFFVESGGLVSYGPNFLQQYRNAAGYVNRILNGEKPADMPVLAPTKYELVINLKTAKNLGLTIPQAVLARADEVIE